MKKTYFAPDMEILEADIQLILAASLPISDTEEVENSEEILAPGMSDSDYDF